MAGERNLCKPHAVMISVPYQGHINPFINLALKLASKAFAITFVHLEFVHHTLSKAHHGRENEFDLFSEARESGLDIRYTTIGDGYPIEYDRVLHFEEYWEYMLHEFLVLVGEFMENIIKSDPLLVHFLVTDTNYPWAPSVAKKFNLVNVSFWTEPALVFSLMYHLDLLKDHGHYPCKDNIEEEITYVPGIESINTRDIMSYLKKPQCEQIVLKYLSAALLEVKKADFVLHNTTHELESETLLALSKYQLNYAVGPINFSSIPAKPTLTKSLWSESDCTNWLENKTQNSVLYISFGSLVQTSKQTIDEIAYGLLQSEVNFIWAIRSDMVSDNDTNNVLPVGFEDAVKDKGLIIPWCDQVAVLSNNAVGGFLTHCGWNSILESIWYGVPMICYPIMYDQPTNSKLVVDDWKIGIRLCDGKPVDREKVAEKIKSFMHDTNFKGLKQEMDKVRTTVHKARDIGGSSENNFDQFVIDLKEKINATSVNS